MYLATTCALILSSISTVTAGRRWVATEKDYGNATFITDVDDMSQQFKVKWVKNGNVSDVNIAHIAGGGFVADSSELPTLTIETVFIVDTATSYTSTVTTAVLSIMNTPAEGNTNIGTTIIGTTIKGDTVIGPSSTVTPIPPAEPTPCPADTQDNPKAPHWALDVFTEGNRPMGARWCHDDVPYSTIKLLKYGTYCLTVPSGTTGVRVPKCMMGGCSTTLFQDANCSFHPTHIEHDDTCVRLAGGWGIGSFVVAC
ncbi:hypothetical protein QBC41DRAFT_350917 [Cercophora samala]|uniref:Uncharacterized protein n=1 Tax=Cercophora samala TaxID=330535 RepID=A0AA40D4Q0_9PEZI|nr:hypothetical protein QBC41DRAFT_350917 [Cercophora samala]